MITPTLTPTGWTILGFLSLSPLNGYQLRAAVQRSVGSFWGVSYGQLYPQLKTLAQAGLIEATDPPEQAETTAARQSWWRLTDTGAEALRSWLLEPAAPTQVRDESLVKLLFSDHAGAEAMHRLIADRRDRATQRKQVAEAIVPDAHWPTLDSPEGRARQAGLLATWLVRAHAIAMAEAELSWCATAEAMIAEHNADQDVEP